MKREEKREKDAESGKREGQGDGGTGDYEVLPVLSGKLNT